MVMFLVWINVGRKGNEGMGRDYIIIDWIFVWDKGGFFICYYILEKFVRFNKNVFIIV